MLSKFFGKKESNTETNALSAKDWNSKGLKFQSLLMLGSAIDAYDKAIKLNPKYAEAWCNKGNALAIQFMFDDSLFCYDEATRIDPNYVEAWVKKGAALGNIGKYNEAIQACDKAIQLGGDDYPGMAVIEASNLKNSILNKNSQ